MSRIGRKPVVVPAGVTVSIDGSTVKVKGPKGELARTFHPDMSFALENGERMASMALQALIDGMGGKDLKQRVDAAKTFLHNFHQPSKQIDLNVNEQVTISQESREAADNMTAEERAIVENFQRHIMSMRPETIEDAEVVEESELPPLPPMTGGSHG